MAVAPPTIFQIFATDNAGTAVALTFEGTGSPDGQVTVYDGVGNAIASGAVAHDGSFGISSPALASGAHNLTLTTTDTLSNESTPTQAVTASVATGATALQSLDVSQLPDPVVIDISATSSAVTLTLNDGANTFFGNDAGDTVNAGNGGNNISTGAGNDLINGGTGGDTILSGGGNDVIHSGGNSSIDAGDGDDTVTAGGGDTIFGGKGSDSITGSATDATAYGGGAADYLIERTGANTFGITSKSTAPEFGSIATPGADSLSGVGTLLFGYDPVSGTAGASVSTADLIGLLSDTDGAANSADDSSTTGTAVHVTAHASDASGDTVSYQLLTAGVPFSIDSSSGILTVSGALDHVSHPSYDLEVEATSSDGSFTRKTFTVTVTGVDVAPVNTVPGAQGVNEDTNLVFSVGNGNAISVADADAGSGVEAVTLGVLHGSLTLGSTGGLTSVSGNGSANVTLSGTVGNLNAALTGLTYRGVADFNGSDTLTVTTNDNGNTGTGGPKSDTDTVAISVAAVSDIANDALTTAEETAITANVLTGTNGASADNFEGTASIASVTQGAHGAVTFNANGNITYTPAADYNGPDSFTYTVANGGANETATVNVTVTPVSDVTNDALTTAEDTPITANVLTGTNGATADNFEGTATIASVTQGAHGAVTFNPNGNVTYTPAADYNGPDSFTYTVANGGANETATVNVTVTAASDVTNDTLTTAEDTAITANVLTGTNGASADNFEGTASIASVTQAAHGAVTFNANGSVTYTPALNFSGPDSFTYTVTNGGANETATVTVTVTAVNDAPINTVPAAQSVSEDANLAIGGLSISDGDAGSGTLTTTLSVSNGTLTVAPAGGAAVFGSGTGSVTLSGTAAQINTSLAASNNLVYRGAANFNGSDTLTVTTNDNGNTGSGGAKLDADTVAIAVNPVNDPPIGFGAGGSILYLENQSPTAVDPGLTVSDPDSANFIGALVAISGNYQAGHDVLGFSNQNGISGSFNAATGVLTLSGTSSVANYQTALSSVTYFNSSDNPSTAARTVDYQVNDGSGFVDIGTTGVNITVVNDPPVITSNGGGDTAPVSIAENTTAVTTVVASDPDSSVTYSIIGGSDAAKFQIDAASGALSFIGAPDFEIPRDSDHDNTYIVQVRAFDGSLAGTQTITVSVTDVSDPLPTLHWARSVDIGPHPAGWLPAGIGDFNGDATSDLAWFNSTTGDVDIWELANGQWAGSSDVGSHPAGYQPAGFGDFNHDGTTDVLWFNATTHDVDLWKISNGQWAGSVDIGVHPAGYTPSGVGDFNNDGTSDVLWFNASTRDAEIWEISNGQWAGSVDIGTHPAGYQPALTGDFNGDGTSDIAWYNPTTGDVDIWKLANGQWAGSSSVGAHPAGWQPLGAADFNLDGTSDIAWINPTNNDIDIWLIKNGQWAGSVDVGTHPGSAVAVGVGDFDHNGVNDILWRNPTDGHVESWMLAFS